MEVADGLPVKVAGAAKNLTGCAVQWKLAKSERSSAALITKTLTDGGVEVPDPIDGVAYVKIDPDDTRDLDPGDYFHECEVIDAQSNEVTVTSGWATLLPSLMA